MFSATKVRRAVLLVCWLGSGLMALSLLLAPDYAGHLSVTVEAARIPLHEAARSLRAGRAPGDVQALADTLEGAERAMQQTTGHAAGLQDVQRTAGAAFGFVAAMNLLLWLTTAAPREESRNA